MAEGIEEVNNLIPVHSMWDGFWISDFTGENLYIGCSFDKISYRNFDIIFYGVIFYNLPAEWWDTDIRGDKLFFHGNIDAFLEQNPGFEIQGKNLYELHLTTTPINAPAVTNTFYVVADTIYAEKCLAGDNRPNRVYNDPLRNFPYPNFRNRVLNL
jgi:hypothetical protein